MVLWRDLQVKFCGAWWEGGFWETEGGEVVAIYENLGFPNVAFRNLLPGAQNYNIT